MLKAVDAAIPTNTTQRYAALDGLRGIAALTVVLSHYASISHLAGFLDLAGLSGVMVFFALSGFLMANNYLGKAPTGEAIADFYIRRIARVVPLYLLIVSVSLAWGMLTGASWPFYSVTADKAAAHFLFWQGVSVLWTIPVEVQFYALFPLIWAAIAWNRTQGAILVLVVMAGLSFLSGPHTPVVFQFTQFFVGGVIAQMVGERVRGDMTPAFVIALALYAFTFPSLLSEIGLGVAGNGFSVVGYSLLMPILVAAAAQSRLADTLFGNKPMRFLGSISYSIYLTHLLTLNGVMYFLGHPALSPVAFAPVYFAAVIAVATASFYAIETQARRWISSYSPTASPSKQRIVVAA